MPHRRENYGPSLATDEGCAARLHEIVADVAFRLAGVCAGLPPDEFAALVRRIATVKVKHEALGERRAARVPTPPEPRTGRSS